MAERSLIFAANWKMNHGPAEARALRREVSAAHLAAPRVEACGSFPLPSPSAHSREAMKVRSDVTIGAQNVHWEPKGAFTGEISIPMVMEAGARADARGTLGAATPVRRDRRAGGQEDKSGTRLGDHPAGVRGRDPGRARRRADRTGDRAPARTLCSRRSSRTTGPGSVLAYEPVWAIGTGKNATPDDAAQIHELIRMELGRHSVSGRGCPFYTAAA